VAVYAINPINIIFECQNSFILIVHCILISNQALVTYAFGRSPL
jgi:hypothetical protein